MEKSIIEKKYMLKLLTHSGCRVVGMLNYIRHIARRERVVYIEYLR